MDAVTLRTGRLVLSRPEHTDADDVVAYATDPDVVAFIAMPEPYGRAEAEHWLTAIVHEGWATDARYEFAIRRAAGSRLLGTVGLFGFVGGSAEIGYASHPDARGQGLVTEAAERVLRWAFAPPPEGLGLVRVQWRALAGNAASIAVARRLGMRYEGRRRSAVLHHGERHDELLAAVLRDDDRSTATDWPVR